MMASEDDEFFDSADNFGGVWVENLVSVQERRNSFLRAMEFDLGKDKTASDIDRIMSDRCADSENRLPEETSLAVNSDHQDDRITVDESDRGFLPSVLRRIRLRRTNSSSNSDNSESRRSWLRRMGIVACVVGRGDETESCSSDSDLNANANVKNQRVKVRPYRKKSKDFSAVFMRQDIKAHDGSILTMKFSPDGQYLASGGEDGVVRVWRVMVRETDEDELPGDEPSCIYFRLNDNSELVPIYAGKEKKIKTGILRRSLDPACVVIPSEVFCIDEKPVHEFQGHQGDVLDLSWSKDEHLLSSSVDKTARLWRVGCESCLRVFRHTNYVTCLQFNPTNENLFISGSIDGKVRLWDIRRSRVVHWFDMREIVSAICYRPDGKIGVAGTISGVCRFFNASDNDLEMDARVSLQDRKKSHLKRITGLQFSPADQSKLMITSADSKVRILDGVDVIAKYKGLRNGGSQISASFTSDGKHIISASEDSNVYVWNYNNQDTPTPKNVKSTRSCERIYSSDASVAITWSGFEPKSPVSVLVSSALHSPEQEVTVDQTMNTEADFHHRADPSGNNNVYLSPVGSFTLSQEIFSEFTPKGTATWPEEELPAAARSSLCKSQYKFLKSSCQNESSVWGQVIVTAGWDGRIRSFRNFGLPVQQ